MIFESVKFVCLLGLFLNFKCLTFSETRFYPASSLDVICHEIGHGITKWHGAKLKGVGQAGGMGESYSDILGMYANNIANE